MKAICRDNYGGPEIIEIREVEKPQPKEKEILVHVYATTVNRTDEGVLLGKPKIFRLFTGISTPRHATLGTDFAGIIEAVGSGVTKYKVGDRVWGFSDSGHPTQAEYTCFPEKGNLAKIPDDWDYTSIVACAEGAHYARNFLNKVDFKSSEKILVYGATGAIGSAMVQMLKYEGIPFDAVCAGKDTALVKSLGADKVIDYQTADFTSEGKKYNFVFDAVGKSNFGSCKKVLKDKGVYISSELGPGNENLYLPITTMFSNQKVSFPFPVEVSRSLAYVLEMIKAGAFMPVIEKIYPYTEAVAAYKHMLSQQKVGNVVLDFSRG